MLVDVLIEAVLTEPDEISARDAVLRVAYMRGKRLGRCRMRARPGHLGAECGLSSAADMLWEFTSGPERTAPILHATAPSAPYVGLTTPGRSVLPALADTAGPGGAPGSWSEATIEHAVPPQAAGGHREPVVRCEVALAAGKCMGLLQPALGAAVTRSPRQRCA